MKFAPVRLQLAVEFRQSSSVEALDHFINLKLSGDSSYHKQETPHYVLI
jgi:hypothetical protein